MKTGEIARGVRNVLAVLLLAAGAATLDCSAAPVMASDKAGLRDLQGPDGSPADDWQFERWWSLGTGPEAGEARTDSGSTGRETFYGPEASSGLPSQFENPFGAGNGVYLEMLRKRSGPQAGAPDLGMSNMLESVLREAWESLVDDNN